MSLRIPLLLSVLLLGVSGGRAQVPVLPPGEQDPILRLEGNGPLSQVLGLAFSPDGRKLYAAGYDKVVRVWNRDGQGVFRLEPTTFRVPVGPGVHGNLNALAVSADGKHLAVGGQGVVRGQVSEKHASHVYPATVLSPEQRLDQGLIFVFDTANPRIVKLLRGHAGPIRALSFVPTREAAPALLVSAGLEWGNQARPDGSVRLWDVAAARELAHLDGLPGEPLREHKPELAAWRTGKNPRAVRVALAWGDGTFRVWDATRAAPESVVTRPLNVTVARLPDSDRVLTATFGPEAAQVQRWDVTPGQAPFAQHEPRRGMGQALAYGLTLIASDPKKPADHAAVIVRYPNRNRETRLQVFQLQEGSFGNLVVDELLWKEERALPLVAAAPAGDHLAVAGHPELSLLVFSIRDLLAGRGRPAVLPGDGQPVANVAFVRKGKDRGLLLAHAAKKAPGAAAVPPAAGDWVFNADQRALEIRPEKWTLDVPDAAGWAVTARLRGERVALEVTQRGGAVGTLLLPERHSLMEFALLPPAAQRFPLLAVASFREGEPRLVLYNARTGARLRELTGHTGRINALAFSADGRLLVSAGRDQTVRVWSITNLDRVLDRVGAVPGLAVQGVGKVTVAEVAPDSTAKGLLEVGEIVLGMVEKDALRKLESAVAFFDAVTLRKPGEKITVRVQGQGAARDVELKVGQGIDERKPLFTLFVPRPRPGQATEWIGWSPLGPYEASGRLTEELLVWHVNTGKPEAPTQVAEAKQYREKFYREGLLRDLLTQAEPLKPKPAPPPPPRMTLLIEDNGQLPIPDARGQVLVRSPRVVLKVSVKDRKLDTLRGLKWQLGRAAGKAFDLEKADGVDLQTPLELTRGEHVVRVVAQADEPAPGEFAEELTVRYQPPAPALELPEPLEEARVVEKAAYTVRARLKADAAVQLSLLHRPQGKEPRRTDLKEPSHEVNLEPGVNTFELVAVNRDALAGHEENETARIRFSVVYKKKDAPPRIAFKSLTPTNRPALAAGTGGLIVETPTVRLSGQIVSEGGLATAEVSAGAGKPKTLAGIADKPRKLDFNEEVTLAPGEQQIRLRARTGTDTESEAVLTVEYRPQLPPLEWLKPKEATRRVAGVDGRDLPIELRLLPVDNKHPFSAVVVVNGAESKAKVGIDEDKLTASVPLQPGMNRLQVRTSNAWKTAALSEPVEVYVAQLPRIADWKGPKTADAARVDLEAEAETPLDLTSASAELNQRELGHIQLTAPEKQGGRWVIRLKGVTLDPGRNVIRLHASNRDGVSEPSEWRIEYTPPAVVARPEIRILEPGEGASAKPEVTLRFAIRSATALKSITVVREGGAAWERSLDPSGLTREGDHYLPTAIRVPLVEGGNRLRVEAANEGGTDVQRVSVTWRPAPVGLEVSLELTPLKAGATALTPLTVERDKVAVFPASPSSRVKLVGRLTWPTGDDPWLRRKTSVRIYVNGFQQPPVELRAPDGEAPRSRTFEAVLLFNQQKENRVELLLPELPREKDRPSAFARFEIDCREPARARRLHVLLVSPLETDVEAMKKKFLDVIQAKIERPNEGQSPVFQRVLLYPPLIGDAFRKSLVNTQLEIIRSRIKGQVQEGSNSIDVVLLYYKGLEVVDKDGHVFRRADGGRAAALDFGYLGARFADMPGAHVLLFDVDRLAVKGEEQTDHVRHWEQLNPDLKHHVAVLRYAWLGQGPAPEDIRLIRALEEAMPKASRLQDVTGQLDLLAAALKEKNRDFSYDRPQPLPAGLLQLPFGVKP